MSKSTPFTDPVYGGQLDTSAVTELLAAGKALGTPMNPGNGLQRYAIVPAGHVLHPIPPAPLRALPDHIRQEVTLLDSASFVQYVKEFRTHTTRLFGAAVKFASVGATSAGGAGFTALLDYHEGGKEDAVAITHAPTATATAIAQIPTKARRVAHVVHYPVALSLELTAWLATNGKAFTQKDFINFVEANAPDIVTPDSASLMEMAQHFEASSTATFQSKIDRTTGGRKLVFREEVTAGAPSIGQLKVPDTMKLSMPVFEGGAAYEFIARMEYRTGDGKLTIAYILQRWQHVFRRALADLTTEISTEIALPILTGEATLTPGWDEPK